MSLSARIHAVRVAAAATVTAPVEHVVVHDLPGQAVTREMPEWRRRSLDGASSPFVAVNDLTDEVRL